MKKFVLVFCLLLIFPGCTFSGIGDVDRNIRAFWEETQKREPSAKLVEFMVEVDISNPLTWFEDYAYGIKFIYKSSQILFNDSWAGNTWVWGQDPLPFIIDRHECDTRRMIISYASAEGENDKMYLKQYRRDVFGKKTRGANGKYYVYFDGRFYRHVPEREFKEDDVAVKMTDNEYAALCGGKERIGK